MMMIIIINFVKYFIHYVPASSSISNIHLAIMRFFALTFWLYLLRITLTEQQYSSIKYV